MAFEMNRRQLLQTAAAGAAGATALSLGGTAQASTPKKGGNFRIGVSNGSTSDSLDPATYVGGQDTLTALAIFSTLVEIDETGTAVPDLAVAWEATPDAKNWTFKLRSGVKFNSGKALEVEDVIASIEHHRGDESKSGAKGLLKSITAIKKTGNDSVTFELEAGNADFPYILADYHMVIMPVVDGKVDYLSGIGTAGYVLEDYEPGVRTMLKRVDGYWKEGKANFDTVEIIVVTDGTARTNALMSGNVDAIDRVVLTTLRFLERNDNINIIETTGTSHFTMPMRADTAPYNDVNVRMAMKHAIDREALVKKVLRGHGAVGNDSPISPANRYYNKDMEQRAYDPDKAKHYLKKAGLDSLDVTIAASDSAFLGAIDASVLFQESAKLANIKLNIDRVPADGYWSNVWMKEPFCLSYWDGRPTEDWMFTTTYQGGADWNESFWKNDRFDSLLIEARASLDENLRREMYYEMQEIVRDDGSAIIPMFNNFVDATTKNVAHGTIASSRSLDGTKCIERWWMT